MDIAALLSPSETPRAASLTPLTAPATRADGTGVPSPFKHVQRAYSGPPGSFRQQITGSPLLRNIQPPSSIPAHVRSPSHQTSHSSPLISPVPTGSIAAPHILRSTTASSIDTLAEIAAMQSHASLIATPPVTSRDSNESSKSGILPHLTSPSMSSNPRASFDIAMVDTQKQVLRSNFAGSSLSGEVQQRLSDLVEYLKTTPSAYESHVEVIKILHQGLIDHIYPSSDPNARRDPRTYDLLAELRLARDNMDRLFAMGEAQWSDWLQDESLLAQTAEERLAVIEKCRRAVEEAYGSAKLWVLYGDWVLHCYNWAHEASASANSGDGERMIGRELFERQIVVETWMQAINETKFDLSSSHLVWNKFLGVVYPNSDQRVSPEDARAIMDLFQNRLHIPHAEWDQTFQLFSSFVSANYSDKEYEAIMSRMLASATETKAIYSSRSSLEDALTHARQSGDQNAEYNAFSTYIEWEYAEEARVAQRRAKSKRDKSKVHDYDQNLLNALYQRAELRFPSGAARWEEHIRFMVERKLPDLLSTLDRATKHCPWSSILWVQYLLSSELLDEPFASTENIKHKATSTGLLDAAGILETLKVHEAWCGYLLRRSRRVDAVEEDSDVAEMGIRSSIENVQDLAAKLGLEADFDTAFRLQRKYIEYLKCQGRFDNARNQFDDAIPAYGKYAKFWLRFYDFEVQRSIHFATLQQDSRQSLPSTSSAPFAVAILKQGLEQRQLDYPEMLMETLVCHCEDFEDAEELQAAVLLVQKLQSELIVRRQVEVLKKEEIRREAELAEVEAIERTEVVANGLHIEDRKRKREDDAEDNDDSKRSRHEQDLGITAAISTEPDDNLKRDREHASILVRNISESTSETRLRQYFSNCGTIRALKIVGDDAREAILEFEEDQAAQYALSRDGRELDGSALSVALNNGATLYITNYNPTADEKYIRNLVESYGDIVSVRFPSLQGNKRRRFCYVEFKLPQDARSATELDGRIIDDLPLMVKISNPQIKQARTESKDPNHTIFVGQLPFKATQEEVERLFAKFGEISSTVLPPDSKSKNRNKGIAFITFASTDDAKAAMIMNGNTFQGRKLIVHVAEDSTKSQRKQDGVRRSMSTSAESLGDRASPRTITTAPPADKTSEPPPDRQQRTVVLNHVPDTVNEDRIRSLAEQNGPVKRVILKTNHQGAIIEFESVADAGKASLVLDGYEIDPGRHVSVTSEEEMLSQKAERKIDHIGFKPKANPSIPATTLGLVKRPAQPGVRRGGHLGQRTAALIGQGVKKDVPDTDGEIVVDSVDGQDGETPVQPDQNSNSGQKSNDDFRNMISGKK